MNSTYKIVKRYLLIATIVLSASGIFAQSPPGNETISLFPSEDSYIDNSKPASNFGNVDELHAMSWTSGEEQVIIRSLIRFDILQIPNYSNIISATFTLNGIGHEIIDQNDLKLNAITGSWTESTVSWGNQPEISTLDQIFIEGEISPAGAEGEESQTENFTVDISAFVQKWVDGNIDNNGMLLSLVLEEGLTDYAFGSREFDNETYRPVLDIIYQEQSYYDLEIFPIKDAVVMSTSGYNDINYGDDPYFRSYSWPDRRYGQVAARSLIDFDFTTIPPNSVIHKATITLSGLNHYSVNASYLRRLTGAWEEDIVTWNTQPGFSTADEAVLGTSESSIQNYEVDITSIVQGWVNGDFENYGLLLMLNDEGVNSSLTFASSDYDSEGDKFPVVSIAFTKPDFQLSFCSDETKYLENWIYSATYDGEDVPYPISEGIVFYDFLGNPKHSNSKSTANGVILASQTIYDQFGRPVISSLPAPTGLESFCYDPEFMAVVDLEGRLAPFSFENFTGSEKECNPDEISSLSQLGKYYSEKEPELEDYVPVDAHPFTRVRYSKLNPGETHRSSLAGTLYAGCGHDMQSYTMRTTLEEIPGYIGHKANPGIFSYTDDTPVIKSISVDPDGSEGISFTDIHGNLLASCISDGDEIIISYDISFNIEIEDAYVDVHIPPGLDYSTYPLTINSDGSNVEFEVYNLFNSEHVTHINCTAAQTVLSGLESPGYYRIINESSAPAFISAYTNYHVFAFNYYDLAGRLKANVPPVNSNLAPTEQVDNMNATFEYNSTNWLLSSHSAENIEDDGTPLLSHYVYRNDGAIRFSQNPQQKNDGKFSYTNYDNLGRIIEVGEYNMNNTGADIVFQQMGLPPDPNSVLGSILEETYSGSWNDNGCTQQTHTEYDLPNDDLQTLLVAEGYPVDAYPQNFLAGSVSKTSNDNNTTWYSYDEQGRLEWMIQEIAGLTGLKTIDYTYNFNGSVTDVTYQLHKSFETFGHHYEYIKNTWLSKCFTFDAIKQNPDFQARYTYYDHGPLRRVNLGGIEDGTPAQGIDYVYTINGWLKTINHPSLDQNLDPGGDANDLFGMAIDYHFDDYVNWGTQINYGMLYNNTNEENDLFSGNIRSVRWNVDNSGLPDRNLFTPGYEWANHYTYNKRNWLEKTDFGLYEHNSAINKLGGGTVPPNENFTVDPDGAYQVSQLTYDENGNINTLIRHGNTDEGIQMDNLAYTYHPTDRNRLTQIYDGISNSSYADDLETQPLNNYTYNRIGQLIGDQTMGNSSVHYNVYGTLSTVLDNTESPLFEYFYDDRGFRVRKEVHNGGTVTNTYYVRDLSGNIICVYQDDIKEYPIYGSNRIGVIKADAQNDFDYYYELTDHLGNVRAVFSEKQEGPTLATHADYYPFGWAMPGRSYEPNFYRFGYQGQFAEHDEETGWNQFGLRLWDGRIGRWMTTDPARVNFSPYMGMGNNPIRLFDPNGAEELPADFIGPPALWQWFPSDAFYYTDQFKTGIINHLFRTFDENWGYIPNSEDGSGGIMFYGYQMSDDGAGHAFAFDPESGIAYEINHPNYGLTHGAYSKYIERGPKSVGYMYTDAQNNEAFWSFGGGRGRNSVLLAPVYVPNKANAISFFESYTKNNTGWRYNLGTHNCKDFVLSGFAAGGNWRINIDNNVSPYPASFSAPFVTGWTKQ